MFHGFIKIATAVPVVSVADCRKNAQEIVCLAQEAVKKNVDIVCFPELCISGYTCANLFHNRLLVQEAEKALQYIVEKLKTLPVTVIAGLPVRFGDRLFNAAVVVREGDILAVIPKEYLSVNENRYFAPAKEEKAGSTSICGQNTAFGSDIIIEQSNFRFSIEIGSDALAPIPPSSRQALSGSQLIFNPSASVELAGSHAYRQEVVKQQSARCIAGYVYVSAGFGESSSEGSFAGHAVIAENGVILKENKSFQTQAQLLIEDIDTEPLTSDRLKNIAFRQMATNKPYRQIKINTIEKKSFSLDRIISPLPFVPAAAIFDNRYRNLLDIQCSALAARLQNTGIKSVTIGVSGGLDSTLALLVCAQTFDRLAIPRKQIHAITMPGFGTSIQTLRNASLLIKALGVTFHKIDIKAACRQHFKDIEHPRDIFDTTYENVQARERTLILMSRANQLGAIVLGTGDLSEMALGWMTYNGDQMSMYAVNAGLPKTVIQSLIQWLSRQQENENISYILLNILQTPISPELLPSDGSGKIVQQTENIIGSYELHDFFLYYMLRFGFSPDKILFLATKAFKGKYDKVTIKKYLNVFLQRFFTQQFKRSAMPDAAKMGSVSLSPHSDWYMPADISAQMWKDNLL